LALPILDVLDRINTLAIPTIRTQALENELRAMVKWIRNWNALPIPHSRGTNKEEGKNNACKHKKDLHGKI
jgi:hypothetical protein